MYLSSDTIMGKWLSKITEEAVIWITTALIQISSCSSDDKPEPMFANEEFTINEGETYTGTIWLNKKWGTPLQIGLVTENRERQAMASNNDYKLNPQTIEFKPGENEQKFIIEALKDSLIEVQEIIVLRLFNIEEMENYTYYGSSSGRSKIIIMINDTTPRNKESEELLWEWP